MTGHEAAGVNTLIGMAVIAVMRKLGVRKIHITRDDLIKAGDVKAQVTQGVADGLRVIITDESLPGPGTPSFEPVFQVRPGRDAGWQDCSEQRYRVVGDLMEDHAALVIKAKQNWTWDRRTLWRRVDGHAQD